MDVNFKKSTGFKQGRLGIGTNQPLYPVDVIGDIRLTGAIRDGSGRLIITTANTNQNAELYNGWKNDLSDNLYLAEEGSIMKIGINKVPLQTSKALDISGGLFIDKIYSKYGNEQHFIIDNEVEFNNVFIKNSLKNSAGEIDISSTIIDDGKTGWLWTGNNYIKTDNDIKKIDISANLIIDGITRVEDHQIEVKKDVFVKNVNIPGHKIRCNNIDLSGTLIIDNNLTLTDNLIVHNIDVSNSLTCNGNFNCQNITFNDEVSITNKLDVYSTDISHTIINQNGYVTGDIILMGAGNLDASNVYTNNIYIDNEILVETIGISGNFLVRPQLKKLDIQNEATIFGITDTSYVQVYNDMYTDEMVINKNIDISAGDFDQVSDVSSVYVDKTATINQLNVRESLEVVGGVNIMGNLNLANILSATSLVGMIGWFSSNKIPPGWLVCDGGEYNRNDYPDLSNSIGNVYGSNGGTSFKVPDLHQKFIRSIDTSTNNIGDTKEYQTGKPNNAEFGVSNAGEHSHTIDPSGGHTHDYSYNDISLNTSEYYINDASNGYLILTNLNGKVEKLPANFSQISPSQASNVGATVEADFSLTSRPSALNGADIPPSTQSRQGDLTKLEKKTLLYGWVNLTPVPYSTKVLNNGANRAEYKWKTENHTFYDDKREWYEVSGGNEYLRSSPTGYSTDNAKKFIGGLTSTNELVDTSPSSNNHTHTVETAVTNHQHMLNWTNTESAPMHIILLPCIKY